MKQKENLEKALRESYEEWVILYKYGGSDPFWEDGVNLNLVRNHIIYYKGQMQEQGIHSPLLDWDVPPVLPTNYMARANEVRNRAKYNLKCLKNNPLYCEKIKMSDVWSFRKDNHMEIADRYIHNLESAIESDDIVAMRRYENLEKVTDYFLSILKNQELDVGREETVCYQMDIFDFLH